MVEFKKSADSAEFFLLGVFSSIQRAQAAVEEASTLPGFSENPSGITVEEVQLDVDDLQKAPTESALEFRFSRGPWLELLYYQPHEEHEGLKIGAYSSIQEVVRAGARFAVASGYEPEALLVGSIEVDQPQWTEGFVTE